MSVTQPTWQQMVTVNGPPAGGLFYVGVRCHEMPTDGRYMVGLPGPDADGAIATGQLPITSPGMVNLQEVTWPPNYSSTLTLTYYQGTTKPTPAVSSIRVVGARTRRGSSGSSTTRTGTRCDVAAHMD
jgi:hypothetical protein